MQFICSTRRSFLTLFFILVYVIDCPSSPLRPSYKINISCLISQPSFALPSSCKQVSGYDGCVSQKETTAAEIKLSHSQLMPLLFFTLYLASLLSYWWFQMCNQTNFVNFRTNLNLYKKKKLMGNSSPLIWLLSVNMSMLLLNELEIYQLTCF